MPCWDTSTCKRQEGGLKTKLLLHLKIVADKISSRASPTVNVIFPLQGPDVLSSEQDVRS